MLFSMGGPYPSQIEKIEKEVDVESQEITFYITTVEQARNSETLTRSRI